MGETPSLKILVLVWPEVSAYHAALRLSRTLTGRGNRVIYAVPAQWQDFVHRQGFETVVLEDLQGRAFWQTSTGWLETTLHQPEK